MNVKLDSKNKKFQFFERIFILVLNETFLWFFSERLNYFSFTSVEREAYSSSEECKEHIIQTKLLIRPKGTMKENQSNYPYYRFLRIINLEE
jgi:hypothetical protein